MKLNKPFAVFDIDGTIVRWQLYHSLAEKIIESNLMKKENVAIVSEAREKWQIRDDSYSFYDYENALIPVMQETLPTIDPDTYEKLCRQVFIHNKDRTYKYTTTLIKSLKKNKYLVFLISGSMDPIVKQLAEYFGCDDYAGSKPDPTKNPNLGQEIIMTHNNKAIALKEMIERHSAEFKGSIGVGDTEGDIDMLSLVENPIAFNPNQALFEIAKKNNWKIVVERKNVIYNLSFKDGKYYLGSSNN